VAVAIAVVSRASGDGEALSLRCGRSRLHAVEQITADRAITGNKQANDDFKRTRASARSREEKIISYRPAYARQITETMWRLVRNLNS